MQKNIILTPVYNDFAPLQVLVQSIEDTATKECDSEFLIVIVNDGTTDPLPVVTFSKLTIEIIHLHTNIGHQKAIAVGLAHIYHNHKNIGNVIIMDSDGEDRPEDIKTLVSESLKHKDTIVFAERTSRIETLRFRLFYWMYKFLFRLLTSKQIKFGNFMIIPFKKLQSLVFYSEIMNHLSAGILKSGIRYVTVPVARGKRYNGKSKMKFSSLILHGLGAITVFIERVSSRLLIFSFTLIGFSLIIILCIVYIRSFTNLAIPGWATAAFTSMLIILLQGFLLSLFTIFLFLSSNSQRKFIPAKHYMDYVAAIQTL